MPIVGILALVQVRVGTHAYARTGIQSNFFLPLGFRVGRCGSNDCDHARTVNEVGMALGL